MKTFAERVEEALSKNLARDRIRAHLQEAGGTALQDFESRVSASAQKAKENKGRRSANVPKGIAPEARSIILGQNRELRGLHDKIFRDTLTGVGNLASWNEQGRGKFPVVVAIDSKHFKHINDTFGHEKGDMALVALAQAMEGARAGLKGRHHIARVGGDEFKAGFDSIEDAHAFSLNLRRNLDNLPPIVGPELAPGPFARLRSKVAGPKIHQHFHAVKIGIGTNEDEADKASYQAGKMGNPLTAVGHHPTQIFSLHPGSKGPVLDKPEGVAAPVRKSEFDELIWEAALAKAAVLHDSFEPVTVYYMRNDEQPMTTQCSIVQGWLEEPVLDNMQDLRKSGYYLAFAEVRKVWRADDGVAFKL